MAGARCESHSSSLIRRLSPLNVSLQDDLRAAPEEATIVRLSDIVCTSKLGDIIHTYSRRAA
ncbi:MAG: hypothetical protein U0996_08895 [Planctomycetaceae bacterium]